MITNVSFTCWRHTQGRKTLLLKPFHVKVGNHCRYWRPSARTFSLSVVISLVQKIGGREAELEQGYDFPVSRRSQGDSLYVEPLYPQGHW